MGSGSVLSGCVTSFACTEIGCVDAAHVTLVGIAEKYASSLPLLIKVCADDSCASVKLSDVKGVVTCELTSGEGASGCFLDGKDLAVDVGINSKTAAKTDVTITVDISDGSTNEPFGAGKLVDLKTTTPNGEGCEPTCHQASASFTP